MNLEPATLSAENAELRARLEESEETLRAIRAGEVDALVVEGSGGPQLFILQSTDAELNRFRSDILAKVNDAVIASDDDQHIIYLNPAAELQYGVTVSEALGRRLDEIYENRWFSPEDRTAASEALLGEGQWIGKNIHIKRNGEIIHVESSVSRLLTKDGNPSGLLSVVRDVTDRSTAEATLRSSEERYRTLFDSIEEGFCIIEVIFDENQKPFDYLFLQVSPSFEKQTGLTNAIGRRMLDLSPTHDKSWFEIYGEVAVTGRSAHFENHAQGLNRWYQVSASRFGDPEKHQVAVIFNDISERKLSEIALQASEQKATNIVQSITDGFITMDRDWRITYLSSRGEEILKPLLKTTTSVIGKVFWDEFPHTLGTPIETQYRHAMETHETVQFESYYVPLGRWFDIRVYPSASGLSLYFLDITERKLTENALRENERALAEQAAALRDADRSKDEFLAMLAHELRNPLAPLRNATEILQLPDASPAARVQAQDLIARQIENMSRMIDDLLDVSRITEGKIELRRQTLSLNTILSAAAEIIRPACEANRQQLTLILPKEQLLLDADPTRLEQILGNLLGNACKYSGDGSHIILSAELNSGEAIIRVTDNGVGIDAEVLPRVFGLFVQSSRTLDRSHGGLGIGLTIVHRLVKLHGGSIEAHSDGLGHGTEFKIRLPVISETVATPALFPATQARPKSVRMLIVDDNRDSAESMAMLQTLHGHETRTAFTGPEALEAAAEFLPQVILLDIGLPGMDGFEVARHLRAMTALKDVFLVALTGYGNEEDRRFSKEAGFDEHLAKPANLDLLRQWLQTRV